MGIFQVTEASASGSLSHRSFFFMTDTADVQDPLLPSFWDNKRK